MPKMNINSMNNLSMRGSRLVLCALLLAWSLVICPWTSAAPARPNIIFILADDLGYGDVGAYKKLPSKIPTPNIDRIAAEGVRFTDAHSPSSVCSPTRYALLTGRYAWRTRLQRGVIAQWGAPLLAPERLTVAELLREQGYATGMFGKWHLGFSWPTKDGQPPTTGANQLSNVDYTQPIGSGPTAHGFDHYFGVDVPNFPPYCFIENDRTVGTPTVPAPGRDQQFNRPGPMLPGWKLEDILPELTKRATQWIEKSAKSGKPFFAYVPFTSPHYPVVPSAEFRGKTKVGAFGDFVHQTDWCVGQILDALKRAGAAENTLVIFTSDNGPEVTGEVDPGAYDRVQRYQHHSMDGLRGAKRDLWEAGHRVPFVARWPARIKPGTVSDETICHVDFLRTVAAIVEAPLPDNAAEDSVNILPALLGQKSATPLREATVHHSSSGKFAIRKGDWVFIDAPTGDDNGARGEPAWFRQERGYTGHTHPGELYNLREDLLQRRNLYGERPEIVRELKELLARYQRNGRSTPGEAQTNDARIGGPAQPPSAPKSAQKKAGTKQ
jgi:arylsulfatase A